MNCTYRTYTHGALCTVKAGSINIIIGCELFLIYICRMWIDALYIWYWIKNYHIRMNRLRCTRKHHINTLHQKVHYTLHEGCTEEVDIFRLQSHGMNCYFWQMIPISFKGPADCSDIVC